MIVKWEHGENNWFKVIFIAHADYMFEARDHFALVNDPKRINTYTYLQNHF